MTALAHPALLGLGLALAAVPVLIHLFFRRRHRVIRWAAMEWLLAALRKQRRRMRMENLILLLLRCALITLLGLAIARPAVKAAAINPFGAGTRSLVLVMDTSASMGAQHTGRRSLDRARERAAKVLSELADDSKVTLVATRDDQTGGAPRSLLENASPSEVRTRLATLKVGHGPNRLGAVFRLVGLKLDRMGGAKLVLLVTDLQRRDWRDGKGARREDVYRALRNLRRDTDQEAPPVTVLDVGMPEAGNVAVTEFSVEAGRETIAGFLAGLTVRLMNFGPTTVDGTLTLFMARAGGTRENKGGQKVTLPGAPEGLAPRPVDVAMHQFLPPGSEGPARFEIVFAPSSGGSDRLPADSRRFLALNVKPPVRVLPVRTYSGSLDILRDVAILEVIQVEEPVDPVALSTRNLDSADAILWADADVHNLEQRGADRLEQYVRRGGGLIAYLGSNSVARRVNELFFREGGEGLFPMRLVEVEVFGPEENPVKVDQAGASTHALFQQAAIFGSPEIVQYWRVKDYPEDAVVAQYTNGQPAVIEHRLGRGRVLIVTTTPDERWFRLNGSLLPAIFFFNAAHYLVAQDPASRNVLAGRPVRVALPAGARQVIVEPPEGAGGRTEEPVGDPSKPFVLTDTIHPGFYRITVQGVAASGASSLPTEEVHIAAVNLDATEGDLRRARKLTGAYQGARLTVTDDAAEVLPRAAGGDRSSELSRALLIAIVALLFCELFLAWRFGSRRRPT